MLNDSLNYNPHLAIRSIGSEVFTAIKDDLQNFHETEIPNLYTASNAGSDVLYYFYKFDIGDEERYIKISGPAADIIDSSDVNQKSFFEHLQALIYPQQGSFSASLLHNRPDGNLTRLYSQSRPDKFGLVLALNPNNLSFGCDQTDGYSDCYDLKNEGINFYGLFDKYLEISGKKDQIFERYPNFFQASGNERFFYGNAQKVAEEFGITKSDFEKVINEEFAKNDGKLVVKHIHAMDGDLIETTFFNNLEKMKQDNISGEILVHQLNTNQNDVILILPQRYRVNDKLMKSDLEIATGLMTFYKEMTSRDVRFATLDSSKHLVTIVELDKDGKISKSANQEIAPKSQTPSASTGHSVAQGDVRIRDIERSQDAPSVGCASIFFRCIGLGASNGLGK